MLSSNLCVKLVFDLYNYHDLYYKADKLLRNHNYLRINPLVSLHYVLNKEMKQVKYLIKIEEKKINEILTIKFKFM